MIIDPRKNEQLAKQQEFMQRLNTWTNNASYRGLTDMEIIGILESIKVAIMAQCLSVTRGKPVVDVEEVKPPEKK